ncbi:MAG TPA: LCP family protein [Solirubrobacteraceae bacterium]|jgi:LCP family protein required for cell wall assembly|nr:LCP family protein [Solirubrobacteraceae bacterium]
MDDERPPRLWLGMWQRFALAGVLIVLLCGGATAAVTLRTANQLAGDIFPKLNQIHVAKGVIASIYTGGPKTFLILGSDKRYGSKNSEERQATAHSDTILLVRFDPEQGQTSVLSIPRDLLVSIKAPDGQVYYPHKINFAYSLGSELHGYGHDEGAALAAETIEHVLPGLGKLNGIIDVTFTGFIRLVDSLGCVYTNVDHRYFHENNGTPEANYTAINLQPGYQKLCYEDALNYVRYRHTDSDFVRVARQQDFLRDLRQQISPEDMLGKIETVANAVGRAISTNFPPSASVLVELTKLIAFSQEKPLRQVPFQRSNVDYMLNGESYVTSTPELEQATLEDFLHGDQHLRTPGGGASSHASSHGSSHTGHGAHHGHPASEASPASVDLYPTPAADEAQAVSAAVQVPFPVLYPRLQTGPATQEEVRPYALPDPEGHLHHAYTVVFQQSILGGYYDVEGTDWLEPPIVAHPQETRQVGSRTYMFFADGEHIKMIAWREHHALYWVINTLLEELTNQQMLDIARSALPLR